MSVSVGVAHDAPIQSVVGCECVSDFLVPNSDLPALVVMPFRKHQGELHAIRLYIHGFSIPLF